MSQQSVLDVQDLYVTFHQDKKSAELVKGVSFSVAPGECLGILGAPDPEAEARMERDEEIGTPHGDVMHVQGQVLY